MKIFFRNSINDLNLLTIKTKYSSTIITLIGAFVFVCLYVIATLYYPGGSQVDVNEKGFSWLNNYWCNLLNDNAINGQHNPAKPIAMAAMLVLCFTLANFWYNFPRHMRFKKSGRLAVQVSGVVAMVIAMFLFTNLHDWVINIASVFALIAIVGTFIGLYAQKWVRLFRLGIFNLSPVALNNILYYGNGLRLYLPVVQKITFLFFLIWICLIDVKMYNRQS